MLGNSELKTPWGKWLKLEQTVSGVAVHTNFDSARSCHGLSLGNGCRNDTGCSKLQFEKFHHVYCEWRKLCFRLSLGLVILDWGQELEGFKVSWEGWDLQSCVWVLLGTWGPCEYKGVQACYKPSLSIAGLPFWGLVWRQVHDTVWKLRCSIRETRLHVGRVLCPWDWEIWGKYASLGDQERVLETENAGTTRRVYGAEGN